MTRQWGRLRLVRKAARPGAGGGGGGGSSSARGRRGARRNLPPPTETSIGYYDHDDGVGEGEAGLSRIDRLAPGDGVHYCLEFVTCGSGGIPLAARVAEAMAAAVAPTPKAQLEELVDSLPSPKDVRRSYAGRLDNSHSGGGGGGGGGSVSGGGTSVGYNYGGGAAKALSAAAAALMKEKRLFSIPLSEPQLAMEVHLLEAGVVPRGASRRGSGSGNGGGSDGGGDGGPSVALELRGVPLPQPTVTSVFGVAAAPPGYSGGEDLLVCSTGSLSNSFSHATAGGGGPTTAAAVVPGADVVMAKRLAEGADLLLPARCIMANRGVCTLLLRFPDSAAAHSAQLENAEAVVASLSGVMPPPVTAAPAAAGGAASSGTGALFGEVALAFPHVPHLLLLPTHRNGDEEKARGDRYHRVNGANGGGARVERSPEPRPPSLGRSGGGAAKKTATAATTAMGAARRDSIGKSSSAKRGVASKGRPAHVDTNESDVDHDDDDDDGVLTVRGATLRVHVHFPGTPQDNRADLAAIVASTTATAAAASTPHVRSTLLYTPDASNSHGATPSLPDGGGGVCRSLSNSHSHLHPLLPPQGLSAVTQSILRAAVILQRLRTVSISPSLGPTTTTTTTTKTTSVYTSTTTAALNDASCSSALVAATPAPASIHICGWRVAQRLQQVHAFRTSIRALVRGQIFIAEDISGNAPTTAQDGGGGGGGGGGRNSTGNNMTSSGYLGEVTEEAREAIGVVLGGGGGAGQETGSAYHSPNRGIDGTTTTANGTSSGSGGHSNTVKGVVPVSLARELAGPALGWTLWQWAYRWPAVAALCQQLEHAALLAAATAAAAAASAAAVDSSNIKDNGTTAVQVGLGGWAGALPTLSPPWAATALTAAGGPAVHSSPQLQYMVSLLCGTVAAAAASASASLAATAGGGGSLPHSPQPGSPAAALPSTAVVFLSALGTTATTTSGGGGCGAETCLGTTTATAALPGQQQLLPVDGGGGRPSSPWSSPALEPVVLPSRRLDDDNGYDVDDMFNNFGHGNWMAEAAALSGGSAAARKVWLPELELAEPPAFLADLAAAGAAASIVAFSD